MLEDQTRRAVAVIRTDLAGARRWRYELNIRGLARRHGLELCEIITMTAATCCPTVKALRAVCRHAAEVMIAPSVAHISNVRAITEFVPLYVVGRSRIYRRGHRWRRTNLGGIVRDTCHADPDRGTS